MSFQPRTTHTPVFGHRRYKAMAEVGKSKLTTHFLRHARRDGVRCEPVALNNLVQEAYHYGYHELQLQTWGKGGFEMATRGLELVHLAEKSLKTCFKYDNHALRVVIKVPATEEGLCAALQLADSQVPVTLTGLYNSQQALNAVACGVEYAAPYLGRMNDAGREGRTEIIRMKQIIDAAGSKCRILVASIRSASEMTDLIAAGCDTFTISPAVADELLTDPLTEAAAEAFEQAVEEIGGNTW